MIGRDTWRNKCINTSISTYSHFVLVFFVSQSFQFFLLDLHFRCLLFGLGDRCVLSLFHLRDLFSQSQNLGSKIDCFINMDGSLEFTTYLLVQFLVDLSLISTVLEIFGLGDLFSVLFHSIQQCLSGLLCSRGLF